jgi:hypothetical protein
MNNRREFLAAGGALAAAIAILPEAKADQNEGLSLYIHGMVWNRQLSAPMNDWLIRLDAKADIPMGATPAFATLGDDFHDTIGSHVQIQAAILNGSQLTLTGSITESKTAGLVGQPLRIEGKLNDSSVEGLTVSIGGAVFSGAGAGRRIHKPIDTVLP